MYQSVYLNDCFSIKKYNDDYYKLTYHKLPMKNPGFELKKPNIAISRNINDEKLDNNLSRAKSKVFEYAACNDFEYFITLTLDPEKYDRYNLGKYIKDLGQDIRNLRRKTGADIQYLLIPEPHQDGAWHMHGLIKGIPDSELKLFTLKDKLPYKVLELIKNGHDIYNWTSYAKKYGWCTVEKVKCQNAVSKYVTKYILKSLTVDFKREKEKKLYYVTRGLKTAEKVKEGHLSSSNLEKITFDYENDYVKLLDLNGIEYLKLCNQLNIL